MQPLGAWLLKMLGKRSYEKVLIGIFRDNLLGYRGGGKVFSGKYDLEQKEGIILNTKGL